MEQRVLLVADIGGTNARFALVEDPAARPRAVKVLRCADYPSLEAAAVAYLDQVGAAPRRAAVAVATALTDDRVKMTNHHWSISISTVRARLDLDELLLINDFTALALALPRLGTDELEQIGGGAPAPGAPIALIGPGTGLGVSGLIPAGDRYVPLQSEGGHVTYGAANRREAAILAQLSRRFNHISAERLMSGPGLVNLYQALAEIEGRAVEPLTPAEVTARGLAEACPLCAEALAMFCSMLGTAAGNLVLTLGARAGVYIGGGIVPRLGDYFAHSQFRTSFEHRGRFTDYLAAVPSYVIRAQHPALLGAAAAIEHPAREVGIAVRR